VYEEILRGQVYRALDYLHALKPANLISARERQCIAPSD
jgi:hypothetical protein